MLTGGVLDLNNKFINNSEVRPLGEAFAEGSTIIVPPNTSSPKEFDLKVATQDNFAAGEEILAVKRGQYILSTKDRHFVANTVLPNEDDIDLLALALTDFLTGRDTFRDAGNKLTSADVLKHFMRILPIEYTTVKDAKRIAAVKIYINDARNPVDRFISINNVDYRGDAGIEAIKAALPTMYYNIQSRSLKSTSKIVVPELHIDGGLGNKTYNNFKEFAIDKLVGFKNASFDGTISKNKRLVVDPKSIQSTIVSEEAAEEVVETVDELNTMFFKRKLNIINGVEDFDKAKKWFESKFPGIEYRVIASAMSSGEFGSFVDNIVTVYDNAERGTTYHEAFHVVMKHYLSPSERFNLLNKVAESKEFKEVKKELSAIYPELKEQALVEEYIANRFQDYMLEQEELPKKSLFKKFFDGLKKFIESLRNILSKKSGKQDLDKLFKHINSNSFKFIKSAYQNYDYVVYNKIKNLNAVQTKDALNSIHLFFMSNFKQNSKSFLEILTADNAKLVDESYAHAKNLFIRYSKAFEKQFNDLAAQYQQNPSEENDLRMGEAGDKWSVIEYVLDTWDSPDGIVQKHKQYILPRYSLSSDTILLEEEVDDVDSEDSPGGKVVGDYFHDSLTYSAKLNANRSIKLLLSGLPKRVVGPGKQVQLELNSLGLPQLESFGTIFNALVNKLANLTGDISAQELYDKLNSIAKDFPTIIPLIQDSGDGGRAWLNLKEGESWSKDDTLLFTQFMQSFTKNRNDFYIAKMGKGNASTQFSASRHSSYGKLRTKWAQALSGKILNGNATISKYYINNGGKISYNKEAFIANFATVANGRIVSNLDYDNL